MKRLGKAIIGSVAVSMALGQAQSQTPDVELWRLDCGALEFSDAAAFSDTHLYDGQPRTLTDSCYLIRNGDRYLLWDAGLPAALKDAPMVQGGVTASIERTIPEQLGDLGLTPGDIDMVAVSHTHFDHVGQLPAFGSATLLIGAGDWAGVVESEGASDLFDPALFTPWLGDNASEVTALAGDHDVFGDGSVSILAMPGHTPGHRALLVRLPETGDVLLTGDLYHFEEQIANRGVPQFNTDRADTLASFERFDQMAEVLDATVIIQHDQRYVDRLPAFPEAAR